MSEREQKSGGVGCFIMAVVGLVGLPLYVFSVGPVAWLVQGTRLEWVCLIYFPIGLLASTFPVVDRAFQWYLNIWLG